MTRLDIRNDRVMIDIACNDPDNGLFAGRAKEIQIGNLLELEAESWWRPPRLVDLGDAIRLAGKRWPIQGSKDWIGNWCWNGYWFDIPVAVDFLSWLHGRQLFRCTTGESRIFNVWESEKPFGENDRLLLWRLLGKPSSYD